MSEPTKARIETVTDANFERVIPLIGNYQRFYRQNPDEARNRRFFGQFVGGHHPQASMFVAFDEKGDAVGFATLYFLPSSLSARTICVLNDLFSVPEQRGKGIGRALMEHCREYARRRGYPGLEWLTERTNDAAQNFYDKFGAMKSEWVSYALRAEN